MSQERTSWKESIRAIAALSAAWLLLGLPAAAESPDVSAAPPLKSEMQNGVRFLTGGVGDLQQKALLELEDDYNVRVALTRPDGAYLADVEVVIEDAKGKSLLETTTRGPLLLAELPPGRYTLHASAAGHATERRMIDVPKERDPVRLYVALPETSDPRGQAHGKERGEEREAEREEREGEGPSKKSQSKSQPQS